jgi:Zn-dependent protease with chaperone function
MINGRYLDGQTAASVPATLELGANGVAVVSGPPQPVIAPLAQLRISGRIAHVPRIVYLPGGAAFETEDNDAVDLACEQAGMKPPAGFVHWLESRWPVALAAVLAVVILTIGFVRWGAPAIADWGARIIPAETDEAIGLGTLQFIDDRYLFRSTLPNRRQQELGEKFHEMTVGLEDGHQYVLELRDGGSLGANAFALPSGIVIMTDQLVELAESDEELVAVLAHEIGHVRGRHALRQMMQSAGVAALAMALLGDSSVSAVVLAAPILVDARYSREFELEADAFARQWLRENGIEESRFDTILCRMTAADGGDRDFGFLSSHPPTDERARCEQ